MQLNIRLQPRQLELLDKVENGSARTLGYGGARGGAKSYAARAIILLRCLKYPKTHALLLRKSFPELHSNHLVPLFSEFPILRKWYNAQAKMITFPNGSTLEMRTANDEGRLARLQGSEWGTIVVDEATHFLPEDLIWLSTCLRYSGTQPMRARMIWTMNPGNVGHAYVKRIFIDKDYREGEREEDFAFVQSFAQDNVVWARDALKADGLDESDYYSWTDAQRFDYFINRTDYGKVLNSLPEALKGPHLRGDWNVFAGQYFDCFDPARHVVTLGQANLQPWYPRWISMDWGFNCDSAIYWHATDEQGRTFTYRELVVNNMTADRIGQTIGQITRAANETIEEFDLSRDAFGRKESERTLADALADAMAPYGIPNPQFADQDRIGGWQLLYQMLQGGQLFITSNCKRLIANIPTLIRDAPKNPEDVLKIAGDDPADAWRYGIKTRARFATRPVSMLLAERLKNVTDPTSFMIHRSKVLAEFAAENAAVRMKPRTWRPANADV